MCTIQYWMGMFQDRLWTWYDRRGGNRIGSFEMLERSNLDTCTSGIRQRAGAV